MTRGYKVLSENLTDIDEHTSGSFDLAIDNRPRVAVRNSSGDGGPRRLEPLLEDRFRGLLAPAT